MITIDDIEANIEAADDAVVDTEISASADIPHLLHGILNALVAQAKVQLLSLQQLEQDRVMRQEQMEIGKSMMGIFGGAPRGEGKDGLQKFCVHLKTGEDIVVDASSSGEAMSIVRAQLRELELDPAVVSSVSPVSER